MNCRWVRCLALLALACGEAEVDYCKRADFSICGEPLHELDDSGRPWPSYSQDLLEICDDAGGLFEAALAACEDGKRVLHRSWGFGVDTRFYDGERLVGRRAHGDLFIIVTNSPLCICRGASFQGTLDSVYCRVTSAEALCGGRATPWFVEGTLGFEPFLDPSNCRCEL